MITISLSNVIELITLILAILTLYGVFYWILINRRHKGLAKDIETVKKNSFYIEYTTNNIVESLINIRSGMEFQNSLLARLLLMAKAESDIIAGVNSAFQKDDIRIEKMIRTMMMFTSNDSRRESAFNQLSESLGDSYSLRAMYTLLPYEERLKKELKSAIKNLERRLDSQIWFNNSENSTTDTK